MDGVRVSMRSKRGYIRTHHMSSVEKSYDAFFFMVARRACTCGFFMDYVDRSRNISLKKKVFFKKHREVISLYKLNHTLKKTQWSHFSKPTRTMYIKSRDATINFLSNPP